MPDHPHHSPLERAVLETVAYADIFSFPVTAYEAHRYLHGVQTTPAHTQDVLDALTCQKQLIRKGDYYCLPHREHAFALREERAARTGRLWAAATDYGQQIARIPFVQMVAVTGSLAVENMDRHGDIDYLIVTSPERLWVVRLMVVVLVKLAARNGVTLCPNYLITTNALTIHERNLFTARELTQMIPLAGMATYLQMRTGNGRHQIHTGHFCWRALWNTVCIVQVCLCPLVDSSHLQVCCHACQRDHLCEFTSREQIALMNCQCVCCDEVVRTQGNAVTR
ncbi:MAG: hypothetical protein AAF653_06220, partial [Chloroflexota bacterium]